jgi:hypothetical protein
MLISNLIATLAMNEQHAGARGSTTTRPKDATDQTAMTGR